MMFRKGDRVGALGTGGCVGKTPNLPPVFLLYFHTDTTLTTLLVPDVCVGDFSTTSKSLQHLLGILQFNSIMTLSTWK